MRIAHRIRRLARGPFVAAGLAGALASLLAFAPPAGAATLAFQGVLDQDDSVATFAFALSAPGDVTFRTLSYSGGVTGSGAVIPAGGFDPVLSLFDGAGLLLRSFDDATPACNGVANDPVTNECFDLFAVAALDAGSYLVAITQFNNEPLGPDLAAGFSKSGADFTAVFECDAGRFCDVDADSRTAFWAAEVSGATVVPAPAAGGLLALAIGVLAGRRRILPGAVRHIARLGGGVNRGNALLLALLGLVGLPGTAGAVELCNGKVATIVGTEGDDYIIGTKLPDVIVGLGGNDIIIGGSGNDTICGGPGDDVINGGNGNDWLDGGSGDDTLIGLAGNDRLYGRLGNDVLVGHEGNDYCDGGVGQDYPLMCETERNTGLYVKRVAVPVWNGGFTPGSGPFAGQVRTTLDGALFVPAGPARKLAVLATHGAFGGYDRGLVGWLGWWLEEYGMTTLVLNRRDSTDYGPNEGGGATLYPQTLCDLKSGVDYLVDVLGYEGVVILGHSKGTTFAPAYPPNWRSCVLPPLAPPEDNDPRVAAVVTFGSIADNREAARAAPLAGPSFEEDLFPGLGCGEFLYDCALAQANVEIAAGRGGLIYEFPAGVQLGNGGLLSVFVQVTPASLLSYYGPETLGVVEREAQRLSGPFLIVHADGDSVTPPQWSDRLFATLSAAGKDVTYLQPAYQGVYPNGSVRDPNRGQPAHSLNAEQSRIDFAALLVDWLEAKLPAASEPASGINFRAIGALPDFDPLLVPPAPNPALP